MEVHTDKLYQEVTSELARHSFQQLQFCQATCDRTAYGRARHVNERIVKLQKVVGWMDQNPKLPAWGKLLVLGFVADLLPHVYSDEPLDTHPVWLTLVAFLKALIRH